MKKYVINPSNPQKKGQNQMAKKKSSSNKSKPKTQKRRRRHLAPRRGSSSFLTRRNPSSMAQTFETLLMGAIGWIIVNFIVNSMLKTQTPAVRNGAKVAIALAIPNMVKHGKFAEAARLGSFALATKSIVDYSRETIFKGSSFAEALAGDELTQDEIKMLNALALNGDNVSMNGDYDPYLHGAEDEENAAFMYGDNVSMSGDYSDLPPNLFGEDDED